MHKNSLHSPLRTLLDVNFEDFFFFLICMAFIQPQDLSTSLVNWWPFLPIF